MRNKARKVLLKIGRVLGSCFLVSEREANRRSSRPFLSNSKKMKVEVPLKEEQNSNGKFAEGDVGQIKPVYMRKRVKPEIQERFPVKVAKTPLKSVVHVTEDCLVSAKELKCVHIQIRKNSKRDRKPILHIGGETISKESSDNRRTSSTLAIGKNPHKCPRAKLPSANAAESIDCAISADCFPFRAKTASKNDQFLTSYELNSELCRLEKPQKAIANAGSGKSRPKNQWELSVENQFEQKQIPEKRPELVQNDSKCKQMDEKGDRSPQLNPMPELLTPISRRKWSDRKESCLNQRPTTRKKLRNPQTPQTKLQRTRRKRKSSRVRRERPLSSKTTGGCCVDSKISSPSDENVQGKQTFDSEMPLNKTCEEYVVKLDVKNTTVDIAGDEEQGEEICDGLNVEKWLQMLSKRVSKLAPMKNEDMACELMGQIRVLEFLSAEKQMKFHKQLQHHYSHKDHSLEFSSEDCRKTNMEQLLEMRALQKGLHFSEMEHCQVLELAGSLIELYPNVDLPNLNTHGVYLTSSRLSISGTDLRP